MTASRKPKPPAEAALQSPLAAAPVEAAAAKTLVAPGQVRSADGPAIAVVGGGLAGLAGAYYLARAGARVTLFERKERLGGRTFAFRDPEAGVWVDNSIHIAMGCCTALTGLLQDIGAGAALKFLSAIPFIDAAGKRSVLELNSRWNALHPIGQMQGILRAGFLSKSERLAVVGLFSSLAQLKAAGQKRWQGRTFAEFAASLNIPNGVVVKLLAPLLIGALNTPYEQCDFGLARTFFLTGLMRNPTSGWMGIFQSDLQSALVSPLEQALIGAGVQIEPLHSLQATEAAPRDGGSVTLTFQGGKSWRGAAALLAIPWHEPAVAPLAPTGAKLRPSPILCVHLGYDKTVLHDDCAGLLESPLQWLFGRALTAPTGGQLVSAVVSCSTAEMRQSNAKLIDAADREVRARLKVPPAVKLLFGRAVKNQPATFLADPACVALRPTPGAVAGQPGLFCAGEWTQTGWPSTMEGAVRSAIMAASDVAAHAGLSHRGLPVVAELPRAGLMKFLLTP